MKREQLENLNNEDLLKIQEKAQMYIDILGCSDAEKSNVWRSIQIFKYNSIFEGGKIMK